MEQFRSLGRRLGFRSWSQLSSAERSEILATATRLNESKPYSEFLWRKLETGKWDCWDCFIGDTKNSVEMSGR